MPTYLTDRAIGLAVAAEIARKGYTRQEIADAIKLDGASLSRSVAGNRQWKATEILRIAEHLDIPVSDLLEVRRPSDRGPAVTAG